MPCCEKQKQLLCHSSGQGLLFLTLDDHEPVHVGFHSRIKVELCLAQSDGHVKDFIDLNTGQDDVLQKTGSENGVFNFKKEIQSADLKQTQAVSPSKNLSLLHNKVVTVTPTVAVGSHRMQVKSARNVRLSQSDKGNIAGTKQPSSFTRSALPTNAGSLGLAKRGKAQLQRLSDPNSNTPMNSSKTKKALTALRVIKRRSEENHQQLLQRRKQEAQAILQKKRDALQEVTKRKEETLQQKKKSSEEKSVVLTKEQITQLMKLSGSGTKQSKDGDEKATESNGTAAVSIAGALQNDPLTDSAKNENSEAAITCEYCHVSFPTKKEYHKHTKVESDVYHMCVKCQTAFPFRAYLLVHMKYHNDKSPRDFYSCDNCQVRTKSLSTLKRHMLYHTGELSFKCCLCSKRFPVPSKLQIHMRMHRSPGVMKCNCCNQFFPSRIALAEHKKAMQKIQCGICNMEFPNSASRLVHYKSNHMDKMLVCKLCNRIYETQAQLSEHVLKHKKRKRKQCRICGKSVVRLAEHEQTHKTLEEMDVAKVFMCDQCPSRFRSKGNLKEHMLIHNLQKLKCHLCSQVFNSTSCYHRHLTNIHSNLMPFQCEVCGKRCKQKSNLKVHMRIHSSAKMFPCSLCSQAFNYKSSLESHLRSKHSVKSSVPGEEISSAAKSCTFSETDVAWSRSQLSAVSEGSSGGSTLNMTIAASTDTSATNFIKPDPDTSLQPAHVHYNSMGQL